MDVPENQIPEVDSRKYYTFLALAVTATIVTFIVIVVIVFMRNRVKLVVQLFKESGKALAVMPFLLLQPILVKIKTQQKICVCFKRTFF